MKRYIQHLPVLYELSSGQSLSTSGWSRFRGFFRRRSDSMVEVARLPLDAYHSHSVDVPSFDMQIYY